MELSKRGKVIKSKNRQFIRTSQGEFLVMIEYVPAVIRSDVEIMKEKPPKGTYTCLVYATRNEKLTGVPIYEEARVPGGLAHWWMITTVNELAEGVSFLRWI